MAKFSFNDADEDPPTFSSEGEKRKRDDGPGEAAASGGPSKARILTVEGEEQDGGAVVGAGRAEGNGSKGVETVVGGEADGISVRIDPDVLDCSICFDPLQPPLYQVVIPVLKIAYIA
jgi:E3 ubiquitin-protein ligase SIAH1